MNYNRQEELYDAPNEHDNVTVIGVGATGSWVALALSKLGVKELQLVDMDMIETHNIPNQLYGIDQTGMAKVYACAALCKELGSNDSAIHPCCKKIGVDNIYDINTLPNSCETLFCLVDSMAARKEIFETVLKEGLTKTFIETRMGLTGYRIYMVDMTNQKEIDKYRETWYSDDEAEVSACGHSQSIVTTAMQCASHAVGLWLAKKNNAEYVPNEIIFDVHSSFILSRKFDKEGE